MLNEIAACLHVTSNFFKVPRKYYKANYNFSRLIVLVFKDYISWLFKVLAFYAFIFVLLLSLKV